MMPAMTADIAYAIGLDAGNRSMRAAGRLYWSRDDYIAALAAYSAAMGMVP